MSEATLARLLVFRVGSLVCAAEVDHVREILPRLPTTRIPGAPPVVAGLVNVRGRLIPVVEGWRALAEHGGAGRREGEGVPASILVLDLAAAAGNGQGAEDGKEGARLIGFTVDEVMDMQAVTPGMLEDRSQGGLAGVDPTLVRAVGRRPPPAPPGQVVIVLDVAALLGPILLQGRAQ
jgi:chemotaxis signal transduction protein